MKFFLGTQVLLTVVAAVSDTTLPSQPNTLIYILAAVAAGGGITGVVSYLRLKKQGSAEKEEIITRAAAQAVEALQGSLTRLEDDLERAKSDRDEMEERVNKNVEKREELEQKVIELNKRIEDIENSIIGFRSKESFIKTVASTYDGIFLVHIPTGEIQYANPAAHIMLDYMFDSLGKVRFDDLISSDTRSDYREIKKEFIKEPASIYINTKIKNLKLITREGAVMRTEIKFTPLENGLAIITAREIH